MSHGLRFVALLFCAGKRIVLRAEVVTDDGWHGARERVVVAE